MQRVSLVTLIVDEISAGVDFYQRAFGWSAKASEDEVAFFQMNGFVLGLLTPEAWEKEGTGVSVPRGALLAVNFPSKAEVDAAVDQAVAGGATLAKEPTEVYWGGYSGYVVDPWGNAIELAHNPFWTVTDDGRTLAEAPESMF